MEIVRGVVLSIILICSRTRMAGITKTFTSNGGVVQFWVPSGIQVLMEKVQVILAPDDTPNLEQIIALIKAPVFREDSNGTWGSV